jgi:hypothetical protein
MTASEEHPPSTPIRASDAERYHVETQLQQHYLLGRLTLAELEERTTAARQARTRAHLDTLVTDLPNDAENLEGPGNPPGQMLLPAAYASGVDNRLLIILLCVHPPAALIYWLIARRSVRQTG